MSNAIKTRLDAAWRQAVEPIVQFLEDDQIIDIHLNADGKLWINKIGEGCLIDTGQRMTKNEAERLLRLSASNMKKEINEHHPSLAAKIPIWHARLQGFIPPIVSAPSFSLRKPAKIVFTLEEYVVKQILTQQQAILLTQAVIHKKNILIGGGTGSGKTTFANALLHIIASTQDRVFIIEDNPELQCAAPNKTQILVQPPIYTIHDAVVDALRTSPDRIIVGEVRDASALALLKSWNTGHPGGIATLHANNANSMLQRVAQLIEEKVPKACPELINETIDYCVYMLKDPTHPAGRRISSIIKID